MTCDTHAGPATPRRPCFQAQILRDPTPHDSVCSPAHFDQKRRGHKFAVYRYAKREALDGIASQIGLLENETMA